MAIFSSFSARATNGDEGVTLDCYLCGWREDYDGYVQLNELIGMAWEHVTTAHREELNGEERSDGGSIQEIRGSNPTTPAP